MSHVVAIINQKGGTGKTTTTLNLGACLAYQGYRTLLIDLDPQGHSTIGLGVDSDTLTVSMADLLTVPRMSINQVAVPTYILGLDIAPATIHLARAAEQVYTRVFRGGYSGPIPQGCGLRFRPHRLPAILRSADHQFAIRL